jgi:hypothetical protein
VGKKVFAISLEEVTVRFDTKCIQELAHMGKLPPYADLQVFAKVLHKGLRAYAQARRAPSGNEVHREIRSLEKAASRGKFEEVAYLLESLSPTARDWIRERLSTPAWRKRGVGLPEPATLRNPAHRKKECELVRQLCTIGAVIRDGRLRPTGKRSRGTYHPVLYGPIPTRHFPRRDAELDLVTALQDAFHRATGLEPAWTAHHDAPGPFARMTKNVLRLAGAPDDAVGFINELHRRRRHARRRSNKGLPPPASLSSNNS